MEHTEKKESGLFPKWVMISITVGVAVAIGSLIFYGTTANAQVKQYENRIGGILDRSYNELLDNVNEMETILSKLMVTNSPQQYSLLLTETRRAASGASAALSQLPTGYSQLYNFQQHLTRISDFCSSLNKKVISGSPLSDQDLDQLIQLHNSAIAINTQLRENKNANVETMLQAFNSGEFYEHEYGSISFKEDQGSIMYPSLIYDGPFAESTEKADAKGLGEGELSMDQAKQAAKSFLGGELIGELNHTGDVDGRIFDYCFEGQDAQGRQFEITITKKGGKIHVLSYKDLKLNGEKPTAEHGSKLGAVGKAYLEGRGFGSMEPTYAQYYDGYGIINYASVQGGVTVYNDLIKVFIDIATGKVIGLDTTNYLFSHTVRVFETPIITAEQAQEVVSSNLQIVSVKLALIPYSQSEERLCYEFKGTYAGTSYIVYINAHSGAEENIFKVIDSEQGQLVL